MKRFYLLTTLLGLMLCTGAYAQERSTLLNITVNAPEGEYLSGQPVQVTQTDYQLSYGSLKLDYKGKCSLNIYPGNNNVTIKRDGYDTLSEDFFVAEGTTDYSLTLTLVEKTRTPYALTAQVAHNAYDGTNSIEMNWNTELPVFFDDFEDYEDWAIDFGLWTGIDADQEAAAPLLGTYPNRGVLQYAQIINPMTVEPTWWVDYPILRPYSGQQYVGFTRTSSGNANDDWLISPAITVGTDNVLSFFAKAADQFPERFMVYVTTKTDSPVQADFVRLDRGNFETADYTSWKEYTYDLANYAGKQVKFAIRYISEYNLYGSFMLMVDDVYVGQERTADSRLSKALRQSPRSQRVNPSPPSQRVRAGYKKSPAHPHETFNIYLDNELVGNTDEYTFTITDVAAGQHTLGVKAIYQQAESQMATMQIDVPSADNYAAVTFDVTAKSVLSTDGVQLSLVSMAATEEYLLTVDNGKATIPSLPKGQYIVSTTEGAFEATQQTINVEGNEATFSIVLNDHVIAPYNITVSTDDDDNVLVRWNRRPFFSDSFEDYDDFATGTFGEWKTLDLDQQPVYPIALGSATNIIAFPGSGSANNPKAIAPMVFNPWKTTPPMLPSDPAIAAPTGEKSIIFFSPQRTRADKWLISPLLDIYDDYQLSLKAKGYSELYPESMDFCVSVSGSDNPADFRVLTSASPLTSEQWSLYTTDLSDFAGQTIRLAVHYTSTDAFLAQLDDFTVGPENGEGEVIDFGNVVRYDIYVDGEKVGESTTPYFVLPALPNGLHILGIRAVYFSQQSELTEYEIDVATAITGPAIVDKASPKQGRLEGAPVYNLQGQLIASPKQGSLEGSHKGVILTKRNEQYLKTIK